jgi:HK97 family phage major capsid protein
VFPSVLEYLYAHTVLKDAGCTLLTNLKGNLELPRETVGNTATWAAENAQIARTAPSFDQLDLSPARVGTVTAYSKILLAQSSLDVENIIQDDIIRVQAVAIDNAAF